MLQGQMTLIKIKANKIGEYQLEISLSEDISKLELQVEARGKVNPSM